MKRLPWLSLVLLLVCYAGFGWYLSGLGDQPVWMKSTCERVFAPIVYHSSGTQEPEATPATSPGEPKPGTGEMKLPEPGRETKSSTRDTQFICGIIVRHNLPVGLLAIAWILLSSLAFISPLTSFSAFVTRWFRSDTVAFMTIVTIAGMAAVILYWLHVFLQILTILAADILARIDIQTAGMTGSQAFWIMTLVSLTGLVAGWLANVLLV